MHDVRCPERGRRAARHAVGLISGLALAVAGVDLVADGGSQARLLLAATLTLVVAGALGARVPARHRARGLLLRASAANGGRRSSEPGKATALLRAHAANSLDPFALRDDKSHFFAGGGMLAYRTVGRTAVVSADPIGSADVVEPFLSHAAEQGWGVAITGASARHLDTYLSLGLRALHMGNEAVVDPRGFSLEGRAVRKVRQSVARVARHGWSVQVVAARDVTDAVSTGLAAVERQWQESGERVTGFAMTLGGLRGGEQVEGVYVLARDPHGEIRAFQRYLAYRQGLSLDLCRRLGGEPNGLGEAMVVAVLEHARRLGLAEVSLNFAGFGHLMAPRGRLSARQRLGRAALRCVHGRFQLERLVRFNDKFFPEWRPRYLVYRRRASLPLTALRVLQVEGYVRAARPRPVTTGLRLRARPATQTMTAARPGASP
jgi:lysyl-tRNA synthetase class 2